MHFTSGINRPPYEGNSGFLQLTSGCSHNGCYFCSYYKTDRFKRSPMEEIEADIKEIPKYFGAPKRIFLQSADAFSADYDVLMKTAELLHRYVPSVETIGGYARIDNFVDKTEEQLRNMKDAGFADPYIASNQGRSFVEIHAQGLRSGDGKGAIGKIRPRRLLLCRQLDQRPRWQGVWSQTCLDTASLYDGIHPSMIDISSLVLIPKTGLWNLARAGKYEEAGEVERLQEMQEFLKALTNDTIFQSSHISVPFHVRTEIPAHKQELIDGIQDIIDNQGEEVLRRFRTEYASQAIALPVNIDRRRRTWNITELSIGRLLRPIPFDSPDGSAVITAVIFAACTRTFPFACGRRPTSKLCERCQRTLWLAAGRLG